ncbi:MAG: hypothetical protein JXA30_22740 [Deltaproteobacteria bacterium]|nr:hypothetical protein [Deltaproteobacteria bacterium]
MKPILRPEQWEKLTNALDAAVGVEPNLAPIVLKLKTPALQLRSLAEEAEAVLSDDQQAIIRLRLLASSCLAQSLELMRQLREIASQKEHSDDADITGTPLVCAETRTCFCKPGLLEPASLVLTGLAVGRVCRDLNAPINFLNTLHALAIALGPAEIVLRAVKSGMTAQQLASLLLGLWRLDGNTVAEPMGLAYLLDACERKRLSCFTQIFNALIEQTQSTRWDAAFTECILSVELLSQDKLRLIIDPDAQTLTSASRKKSASSVFDMLVDGTAQVVCANFDKVEVATVLEIDDKNNAIEVAIPDGLNEGWVGVFVPKMADLGNTDRQAIRDHWTQIDDEIPCLETSPVEVDLIAQVPTPSAPLPSNHTSYGEPATRVAGRPVVVIRPAILDGTFHRVSTQDKEKALSKACAVLAIRPIEPAWLDDADLSVSGTPDMPSAPSTLLLLERLNLLAGRASGLDTATWVALVPQNNPNGFYAICPSDAAQAVIVSTPSKLVEALRAPVQPLDGPTLCLRIVGSYDGYQIKLLDPIRAVHRMLGPGSRSPSPLIAIGLDAEKNPITRRRIRAVRPSRVGDFVLLLPITPHVVAVEIWREPRSRGGQTPSDSDDTLSGGATRCLCFHRPQGAPSVLTLNIVDAALEWELRHSAYRKPQCTIEFGNQGLFNPVTTISNWAYGARLPIDRLSPGLVFDGIRVVASDGWNAAERSMSRPDDIVVPRFVMRQAESLEFWLDTEDDEQLEVQWEVDGVIVGSGLSQKLEPQENDRTLKLTVKKGGEQFQITETIPKEEKLAMRHTLLSVSAIKPSIAGVAVSDEPMKNELTDPLIAFEIEPMFVAIRPPRPPTDESSGITAGKPPLFVVLKPSGLHAAAVPRKKTKRDKSR